MSQSKSSQSIVLPTNSSESESWRALAEQASREQDPQKLFALVSELCAKLDEQEAKQRNPFLTHRRHEGIQGMLQAMIAATHADFGNIQLLDTSDGTLKIIAAQGFDSEFLQFFAQVGISENCACSAAMKDGSRIVVADVERDPLFSTDSRGVLQRASVRSLQSTPLLTASGRLLGVVSTHYLEVNRPNEGMWEAVDDIAVDFVRQLV